MKIIFGNADRTSTDTNPMRHEFAGLDKSVGLGLAYLQQIRDVGDGVEFHDYAVCCSTSNLTVPLFDVIAVT